MASYSIAVSTGAVSVDDKTLVANTADTITFDQPVGGVEILTDGTAKVYFTVDGTAATVGGSHCYEVPTSSSATALSVTSPQIAVVSVVSAGAPVYSVARAV